VGGLSASVFFNPMSILRDAFKVIEIAERQRPSLLRSGLWKTAKARLLRTAVVLETEWQEGDTMGAREGSLEDEECQDPGNQEASTTDLSDMLQKLLGKQPPVISQSSTGSQTPKIVQLTRSTRLPRT